MRLWRAQSDAPSTPVHAHEKSWSEMILEMIEAINILANYGIPFLVGLALLAIAFHYGVVYGRGLH